MANKNSKFTELLWISRTLELSWRKSTNDFRHSLYPTVSKRMPPRWRAFFPPNHVAWNLFTRVAWGEIFLSGTVNLENVSPRSFCAASWSISASFPPQLDSMSKTTKTQFLPLMSSFGHVTYFFGGRQIKAGTDFSNSFIVSCVTFARLSKSGSRVKAMPDS